MIGAGTLFVALAALLWGVAGILLENGWDPSVITFYRGAIGLLLFLPWWALRPRGRGFDIGRGDWLEPHCRSQVAQLHGCHQRSAPPNQKNGP